MQHASTTAAAIVGTAGDTPTTTRDSTAPSVITMIVSNDENQHQEEQRERARRRVQCVEIAANPKICSSAVIARDFARNVPGAGTRAASVTG